MLSHDPLGVRPRLRGFGPEGGPVNSWMRWWEPGSDRNPQALVALRCTNTPKTAKTRNGRTLRLATLPALYRAQNQENREIPFSESKNTLFHPPLGTHLNGHFRAFKWVPRGGWKRVFLDSENGISRFSWPGPCRGRGGLQVLGSFHQEAASPMPLHSTPVQI